MLEFVLLASTGAAHGTMVHPPIWLTTSDAWPPAYSGCYEGGCMWFSNATYLPTDGRTMAADSPMRTFGYSDPDFTTTGSHPWAAPGLAENFGPCGVFGGNPFGCPVGDEASRLQACGQGGMGFGVDLTELYGSDITGMLTTTVAAGGVLEAGFAVEANHGGGYAYRLCKAPEDGDMTKLTEECFQAGHLDYASTDSYMQFGADTNARIPFEASRTTEGTTPTDSVWTQNPIAPCATGNGGDDNCALSAIATGGRRTQFAPKIEGMQGAGELTGECTGDGGTDAKSNENTVYTQNSYNTLAFVIVDELQIPSDLEPGKYVLSWRWDCEQTAQIWAMCSDIEVTAD